MRQIKFRAKTTANGHWVYGSLIDYGDKTFAIRNSKSQPWVQADTVGQFTGLLDRNGTEIYEGDIIAIRVNPCEVKWNGSISAFCVRFYFEIQAGIRPIGVWLSEEPDSVIIGNIHDNNKILKESHE